MLAAPLTGGAGLRPLAPAMLLASARRLRAAPVISRMRRLHWPASPNPTPYQIFGIEPKVQFVDQKQLRAIYFQLVKLYHPDRGTTGDAERFKRVVEAHNILKDESRRRSYDLTRAQAGVRHSPEPTRYHRSADNSWDEDADLYYWSNRSQEKFRRDLHESRVWVLKLVAAVTVTLALINLAVLKERSGARRDAMALETDRLAEQLAYSSTNRGYGGDAQQRIERFLEDRQRMLDRLDNNVRWSRLKAGKPSDDARAERPQESPSPEPALPAASSDALKAAATPSLAEMTQAGGPPSKSNGVGKPQMKHHSGPVAEYFGRN